MLLSNTSWERLGLSGARWPILSSPGRFGIYKPYFRYQYVNDSVNDPINLLKGTYYGSSVGLRIDFSTYAAFKLQYNHLYESSQLPGNGFDAQFLLLSEATT